MFESEGGLDDTDVVRLGCGCHSATGKKTRCSRAERHQTGMRKKAPTSQGSSATKFQDLLPCVLRIPSVSRGRRSRLGMPEKEIGVLSATRRLCTCFSTSHERFGRERTGLGQYRTDWADLVLPVRCWRRGTSRHVEPCRLCVGTSGRARPVQNSCEDPRPVVHFSATTSALVIGQAPGTRVHPRCAMADDSGAAPRMVGHRGALP
jgi:hypothetical protein